MEDPKKGMSKFRIKQAEDSCSGPKGKVIYLSELK